MGGKDLMKVGSAVRQRVSVDKRRAQLRDGMEQSMLGIDGDMVDLNRSGRPWPGKADKWL
jgi:hypothetical protein